MLHETAKGDTLRQQEGCYRLATRPGARGCGGVCVEPRLDMRDVCPYVAALERPAGKLRFPDNVVQFQFSRARSVGCWCAGEEVPLMNAGSQHKTPRASGPAMNRRQVRKQMDPCSVASGDVSSSILRLGCSDATDGDQ